MRNNSKLLALGRISAKSDLAYIDGTNFNQQMTNVLYNGGRSNTIATAAPNACTISSTTQSSTVITNAFNTSTTNDGIQIRNHKRRENC